MKKNIRCHNNYIIVNAHSMYINHYKLYKHNIDRYYQQNFKCLNSFGNIVLSANADFPAIIIRIQFLAKKKIRAPY